MTIKLLEDVRSYGKEKTLYGVKDQELKVLNERDNLLIVAGTFNGHFTIKKEKVLIIKQ